ncbi:MAG: hypothetical protein EHM37_09805, partial [Deltaproteobacteria bacterium]
MTPLMQDLGIDANWMVIEGSKEFFNMTKSIRSDLDLDDAAIRLSGMLQGIVNIWALSNYSFDLTAKYESLWSIYQKAIQTPEQQP